MKKAFTLSEVIITMGIVGVISILTVPAVMKNYKQKIYVTSLQKTVSQINDANLSIMQEEMTNSLYETTLADISSCNADPKKSKGACYFLNNYFKVMKRGCGPKSASPDNYCLPDKYTHLNPKIAEDKSIQYNSSAKTTNIGYCIQNTNGITICGGYNHTNGCPTYYIDVNGEKEPNVAGRDFFSIDLMPDGSVRDYATGGNLKSMGCPSSQCGKKTTSLAEYSCGCLNSVIENSWQMKY